MTSDDAPVSRRSMLGGLAAVSATALAGCSARSPWAAADDESTQCPYCGRGESFQHSQGAIAWIVGHVHVEHPDELPDFEGTA